MAGRRRGTGPLRRSAGRGPGKGRVRRADQRCAPAPAWEPDLEYAAPAGPERAARRNLQWPRTLLLARGRRPPPPAPPSWPGPAATSGRSPGTRSPASGRLGTRMKDRLEQLKAVSPAAPGNRAGRGLRGWSCAGEGLPSLPHIEAGRGECGAGTRPVLPKPQTHPPLLSGVMCR